MDFANMSKHKVKKGASVQKSARFIARLGKDATFETGKSKRAMRNFFRNNKKEEPTSQPQSEGGKRSLDALQDELDVLDDNKLERLGGGKSTSKSVLDFFDLSSSCGDTIPQ